MNKVEIPINVVQAILNYLQGRPYQEVAGLISEIMQHQPAVREVDSEADTEADTAQHST
jgi:hypothetical protein